MLAKYQSLQNKNKSVSDTDLSKPDVKTLLKTTLDTKNAIERVTNGKIKSVGMINSNVAGRCSTSAAKYFRYTPQQQGLTDKAEGNQRIIKLCDTPRDPMEFVKFKHKRIPRDAGEEPLPVMQSPPRKVTAKDQQDWKVVPCISNWKNGRGYTIPLEMRLSADGRNLRDFTVNEKFSKFADVMYMTEKEARKEVEERSKLQEAIKVVDTLKKEEELREAAKEARQKKISMVSNISSVNTTKTDDTAEVMLGYKRKSANNELEAEIEERNALRNIRKKEIERERRQEFTKHKKNNKESERDISEKIALGQAQPTMKENMIDTRLYNQTTGLEAGFKDEEDYDLYDKPLFVDRTSAAIYKNLKASSNIDDDGGADHVPDSKKIMEKIYKRGNMFEGADIANAKGGKPVEFEKAKEEYGLNDIHKKK